MCNGQQVSLADQLLPISKIDSFIYLGAKVSKQGVGMKDIKVSVSKARAAFRGLKQV